MYAWKREKREEKTSYRLQGTCRMYCGQISSLPIIHTITLKQIENSSSGYITSEDSIG